MDYIIKCFGLCQNEINSMLAKLGAKKKDVKVEENCLDARIVIASENNYGLFSELIKTLGGKVYADNDATMAEVIINHLTSKGKWISVAESITGGLIASSFIDIDGASKVFYEGLVTYNSASKVKRLHTPADVIEKFGVVSLEVARTMAFGLLSGNKEIDYVIVTTGYAGDITTGQSSGKAFIGVGSKNNKEIAVKEVKLFGNRNEKRKQCCNHSLFALIEFLKINIYEVE